MIHPFALPGKRYQSDLRIKAWLNVKHSRAGDYRIQANMLTALVTANIALSHMLDFFSREYFLERIEHAADDMLTTSVYERFSLAPGQRFLSKGAYVAQLSNPGNGVSMLEPVSEWIIP